MARIRRSGSLARAAPAGLTSMSGVSPESALAAAGGGATVVVAAVRSAASISTRMRSSLPLSASASRSHSRPPRRPRRAATSERRSARSAGRQAAVALERGAQPLLGARRRPRGRVELGRAHQQRARSSADRRPAGRAGRRPGSPASTASSLSTSRSASSASAVARAASSLTAPRLKSTPASGRVRPPRRPRPPMAADRRRRLGGAPGTHEPGRSAARGADRHAIAAASVRATSPPLCSRSNAPRYSAGAVAMSWWGGPCSSRVATSAGAPVCAAATKARTRARASPTGSSTPRARAAAARRARTRAASAASGPSDSPCSNARRRRAVTQDLVRLGQTQGQRRIDAPPSAPAPAPSRISVRARSPPSARMPRQALRVRARGGHGLSCLPVCRIAGSHRPAP